MNILIELPTNQQHITQMFENYGENFDEKTKQRFEILTF